MTLHREIFLTVVVIITGMMIALAAVIYQTQSVSIEEELQRKISATQASAQDLFEAETNSKQATVSAIAKDWALRSALGGRDKATIRSVLSNHSHRINASFSFFVDQRKNVYPGLIPSEAPAEEIEHLLNVSQLSENHLNIVKCGEDYFLVIHQEVSAPTKLGYLVVGFNISHFETIINNVAAVSQLTVQLYDMKLSRPVQLSKQQARKELSFDPSLTVVNTIQTLKTKQGKHVVLLESLVPSNQQMRLGTLFTGSLSYALAELKSLWFQITYVFALCLLVTLFVTYFFSKKITKPLLQLLNNTGRLTEGNYSEKITIQGGSEITELAKGFAQMQSAVLAREKKIVDSANTDALCGIANRQKFRLILQESILQSKLISVLLLDIDKFKTINDSYGHVLGDRLIKYFAKLLKREFGKQCLVARIGGDEFAVIGFGLGPEDLKRVIIKIEKSHKKEINLSGYSIPLRFSSGIAVSKLGDQSDQLIHRADIALYAAKLTNDSVTIYNEKTLRAYDRNLKIISELQNVKRNDIIPGLYLEYQPKYELLSGAIIGVEALCRWENKALGHLSPLEFIQHAEDSGTITQLTNNIVSLAMSQQAQWQSVGLDIPVAVNVSPVDIRDKRFCNDLTDKLKHYEIEPSQFELEITEHVFIEDSGSFSKQFERLNDLGIKLSIDDFGSGYANLNGLKDYPFASIKIDQQFVRLINKNQRGEIIVKTVINLAKELGVTVIAEGIETESEFKALVKLGCQYGQGYYFSRPVPGDEIQKMFNLQISGTQ